VRGSEHARHPPASMSTGPYLVEVDHIATIVDRLTFRAGTLLMALGTATACLAAQSPYRLGPNVQVTHAATGYGVQETYVCADPRDGRRMLAAAIVEHADTTSNQFFVSADGGASWKETLTVAASVDPSCAIGQDGMMYAASVHDSMPSSASYLNVRRSVDGGRHWIDATIHDNMRSLDRAYVTTGPGGRVFVHAYVQAPVSVAGTKGPAVAVLYASQDSGQSFNRVATLDGTAFANPWFFPANGIVTKTGAFVALMAELDNAQRNMFRGRSDSASAPHAVNGELRVIRSRAGQPVAVRRVAEAYYDWRVPQLSMPSLASDNGDGPCGGRLYATWPDARYGRRTQILISRSDDEGQTWTPPRVVSDGPDSSVAGPNNFMPTVAVNSASVVAVSWYDRRDNPDSLSYWPRLRASLDCGESWLPSIRVSSSPNHLKSSDRHLNGGDTSGLAADAARRFHVVWIDNRTGMAEAWAGTVEVRGRVRTPQR
jgi:hypothetical protein